jgi:4-carboxymuconolactone decarboxylase
MFAVVLEVVLGVVLAVAGLATLSAQQRSIEDIQLRGDRFRGLHYRQMTPDQRTMLDHTVNSARAVTNTTANGPFNVLLRSPEVGDLSQALGNAIRFSSGLSGRLRELVTLMAGRAWSSKYEWYAHARYAADEGLAPTVIDDIAQRETPDRSAMTAEEWAAWQLSDELLYTRRVSDATFAAAHAVLGDRRLVSAVTLAAYYEYISMILNVDRYPLPADAPPGAERALAVLPVSSLVRSAGGPVSARRPLESADVSAALTALAARVNRDDELPADVRASLTGLVARMWNEPLMLPIPSRTAVVDRFAVELLSTRAVSDDTFAAALKALGERRLVNALVLMGHANIRCAQSALTGGPCR